VRLPLIFIDATIETQMSVPPIEAEAQVPVDTDSSPPEPQMTPSPVPVVTNVPPRTKRPMSDEALAKLAEARKLALVAKQAKVKERLLEKAAAIPAPPPPPETPKKKSKRPAPQVIIEASSSDEDEYESPQILVVKKKRASRAKKEEDPPPKKTTHTPSLPPSPRTLMSGRQDASPSLEDLIARTFVRV